jgi:hypothetical protein
MHTGEGGAVGRACSWRPGGDQGAAEEAGPGPSAGGTGDLWGRRERCSGKCGSLEWRPNGRGPRETTVLARVWRTVSQACRKA